MAAPGGRSTNELPSLLRGSFFALLLLLPAIFQFGSTQAAYADALDDTFARLSTDKFPETEKAVPEIAASGLPIAAVILDALADNRLYFDPASKTIYVKDASGAFLDARSGAAAKDIDGSGLKRVRLNNAVRSALDASRGALTLMSPDPRQRANSADAVFKSHDESALAGVETALSKEAQASIKLKLQQARAAILLFSSSASEADKIAAVDVVAQRGDQDALNLLSKVAANANGAVQAAAQAALKSVQTRQALLSNVQNIFYGLSLGSILLLAVLGLAITFGVMGVINMAHGEMVMLGAYTAFVVQRWIIANQPALADASLIIAIPLAFIVTAAVGVAIERTIIRFLYGRPLETLLATFGVSLVLQQAVRTIFGADNQKVAVPSFMGSYFNLGGLTITSGRMWIIFFAIAVFLVVQSVLRLTPFGLRMRAVTQNRRMASAIGIDTGRIDALAFGLGSGIAGMAGVALTQIDNVSPNLGQTYIIDSFMVVVFGGVGNLWGTLVAGLTIGVANKFMEPFVGAVLAKILLLVLIILFIQKRPRGMFALKGRAVEA